MKSARTLLDVGDTDGACSRAYCAMHDAARATLEWAGVAPERGSFKTHQGLSAAFSLHLVKAGLFPGELSSAIQRAQTVRLVADYDSEPVPREDAERTVLVAESFVAAATALVAAPCRDPAG